MLSAVIDRLVQWDHAAWYYMNTQWHNAFLDAIIPFLRNQYFWAPLYLFLLIFMPSKFKLNGWVWCTAFLITFILSDQISAHLMKPIFHRVRPCNNPALNSIIHLIVPCGSGYSFPSSHAANHFAMGIFSAITLGKRYKWVLPLAIVWAISVSFAQVYVGVHYPIDVTCGGIIGTIIGISTGKLFNRYFGIADSRTITDVPA